MGLDQQKKGIIVGFSIVAVVFGVFCSIYFPIIAASNDNNEPQNEGPFIKPVDAYVSRMHASNVMNHLKDLQNIATDNDGTRAVGTPGYKESVDYIIDQLKDGGAKCDPKSQSFQVDVWTNLAPPKFTQMDPLVDYTDDTQILQYSGSGNVTGLLGVLPANNFGCTTDSWQGVDVDGKIALVIRGDCGFNEKASSAFANGATGVLIYNDGASADRMNSFTGTLGEMQPGPVFSLSHSLGHQFSTADFQFYMFAETSQDFSETWNVLCEWDEGNDDSVIVVGSHLDSVPAGPGINDNGSGSALNLELALNLAKSPISVENKVLFAWWGAEEIGLKGSEFFVQNAEEKGELSKIQLNLNFDMIGSPNSRLEVYDGTKVTNTAVYEGCVAIQSIFEQYFDMADIPFTNVDKLNGNRSDYAPFMNAQIPAGGLSTGHSDLKSNDERLVFGGFANAAYDPCYHLDCDNVDNIDKDAVQANLESAAYAVGTLASAPKLSQILGSQSKRVITEKNVFSSV